jgi:hypothetical protein
MGDLGISVSSCNETCKACSVLHPSLPCTYMTSCKVLMLGCTCRTDFSNPLLFKIGLSGSRDSERFGPKVRFELYFSAFEVRREDRSRHSHELQLLQACQET